MTRRIELGWEHPETEEAFRVVCEVTPGTPDRGPDMACAGGYPGDPPEVEILSVVEDKVGGRERPDLIAAVAAELGFADRAQEEAAEPDDHDAAYEYRRDEDAR